MGEQKKTTKEETTETKRTSKETVRPDQKGNPEKQGQSQPGGGGEHKP